MTITELDPIKHDLRLPQIVCDQELDTGRKQLKEPLPNCSANVCFVGKPGSGQLLCCTTHAAAAVSWCHTAALFVATACISEDA